MKGQVGNIVPAGQRQGKEESAPKETHWADGQGLTPTNGRFPRFIGHPSCKGGECHTASMCVGGGTQLAVWLEQLVFRFPLAHPFHTPQRVVI